MAFAQQKRKPKKYQSSISEEYSDKEENEGLFQRKGQHLTISDSDTDWHVLSHNSSMTTSPILFPSSTTSSFISFESKLISDTEEESNTYLPFHDGTGTFLSLESDQTTTSEDEIQEQEDINDLMKLSLPFIIEPPQSRPTIIGFMPEESTDNESIIQSIQLNQENLDSIPIHHPDSSGSDMILNLVWNSLKRFRNHLIENDTNTIEQLSNLMSEAVFEGCMPFSSHLHMEFDNTFTNYSFFDNNLTI